MSNYPRNKARSRTRSTTPTMTDQSQARDTDINVIVGRFLKTGAAPGPAGQAMSGDFTKLPEDLRGFIETSRDVRNRRRKLPAQLREMPIEELLALTPDKLTTILTPPASPPAQNEGETK